jgi:hypothetical protein
VIIDAIEKSIICLADGERSDDDRPEEIGASKEHGQQLLKELLPVDTDRRRDAIPSMKNGQSVCAALWDAYLVQYLVPVPGTGTWYRSYA